MFCGSVQECDVTDLFESKVINPYLSNNFKILNNNYHNIKYFCNYYCIIFMYTHCMVLVLKCVQLKIVFTKKNHIIIKSKDYVNLKDEFLYLQIFSMNFPEA